LQKKGKLRSFLSQLKNSHGTVLTEFGIAGRQSGI